MNQRTQPLALFAALAMVTAAGLLGVARSSGEPAQAAAQAVPTNISPPTISGIPQESRTLVANSGTWSGDDGQRQYQWQRCGTLSGSSCRDIAGATSTARLLVRADVGSYIRVKVRAHNSSGWSPFVSSAATAQVAAARAPGVTRLPSISGTAREGETLTADRGGWTNNPTSFAYRWQRCNAGGRSCSSISGATASTRVVTGSDVGRRLRVVVTARNAAGSSSAVSAPTDVVARRGPPPVNTAAPVVSGDAEVGKTLTVSTGTWANNPTSYRYQWQRCNADSSGCASIPGETRNVRIAVADDAGKRLRALVTARNASGSTQAASTLSGVIVALPAGTIRLPNGQLSVPVSSVSLPERLIIDRVSFRPNPVRSRAGVITARFRVVDTRGYAIRDALVFARTTPIVTSTPNEQPTDQAGWVTMTFRPRASFPLRNRHAVQVFVRARKPGENVLAGISTRRLVQVRTARPR
jgi:hypothetical protein